LFSAISILLIKAARVACRSAILQSQPSVLPFCDLSRPILPTNATRPLPPCLPLPAHISQSSRGLASSNFSAPATTAPRDLDADASWLPPPCFASAQAKAASSGQPPRRRGRIRGGPGTQARRHGRPRLARRPRPIFCWHGVSRKPKGLRTQSIFCCPRFSQCKLGVFVTDDYMFEAFISKVWGCLFFRGCLNLEMV
jgi:hypothetical protein